jgi:aquaporin Z
VVLNANIFLLLKYHLHYTRNALLGSLFVKYAIGFNANLGANAPNYSFSIPIVFGEVLASALLMAIIFMTLVILRVI